MAEITTFADASRFVYQGSQGIEIIPGLKNHVYPRKRPQMAEITSFADATRVVYRGLEGIIILPRPENHGL